MRRLFKLKHWLLLDETAKYLSILLEEPIDVPDVLRLALDGHLTLSMDFVNHASASIGRVIPFAEVPTFEADLLSSEGSPPTKRVTFPLGFPLDPITDLRLETPFLHFQEEVISISGVWDLAMMGNDRIDIEYLFHRLTGGPEVELSSLDGIFVRRPDGTWASLKERLRQGTPSRPDEYYPAGKLPSDGVYVVRTDALRDFERNAMGDGSPFEAPFFDADSLDYPELLAIAVRAWEQARKTSTGTPKQRVLHFLAENYPSLQQGSREAIAQVVNWQRTGGRPVSKLEREI